MTDQEVARYRSRNKESIRFRDSLPESFISTNEKLIELIESYFDFLNSTNTSSGYIMNTQLMRDIDSSEDRYFSLIEDELSPLIPSNVVPDKKRLFRLLTQIYASKGTKESIEAFFRLLYNEKSTVYYPRDDLFILDSGNWDSEFEVQIANTNPPEYFRGIYLDNKGFLDDLIYMRDDNYYQEFSYEVRTGISPEEWKDYFDNLIHPSGFISFGKVNVLIEILKSKLYMPKFQPGFVIPIELYLIFSELFEHREINVWNSIFYIFFIEKFKDEKNKIRFKNGLRHFDSTPMIVYSQYTTKQLQELNFKKYLPEQEIKEFDSQEKEFIQFVSGSIMQFLNGNEFGFLV